MRNSVGSGVEKDHFQVSPFSFLPRLFSREQVAFHLWQVDRGTFFSTRDRRIGRERNGGGVGFGAADETSQKREIMVERRNHQRAESCVAKTILGV